MVLEALGLQFVSGEANLFCVDHDHKIACIDMRGVLRLVLAAQQRCNLGADAPQGLVCGINQVPLADHGFGFGLIGFLHVYGSFTDRWRSVTPGMTAVKLAWPVECGGRLTVKTTVRLKGCSKVVETRILTKDFMIFSTIYQYRRANCSRASWGALLGALVIGSLPQGVPAQAPRKGQIDCTILENGATASGVMVVRRGGQEMATGTCGKAVSVDSGSYEVVMRLDGALDRPEKVQKVNLKPGSKLTLNASFETGLLELHATQGGRKAAAMAVISQSGRRVGSLGMGVTGRLSTGSYDVALRYRGEEKQFNGVTVSVGARRVLDAAF